jgi:uncharacterized OB-fold protein
MKCSRLGILRGGDSYVTVTNASKGTAEHPWPYPAISMDTAFFWEGTPKGELRIQHCVSCGTLRHPPRPCCPKCLSFEWDYILAKGTGEIVSYAVYHYPALPPFEAPYVVALIQLPEGTRIVGNILDAGSGEVEIGMNVQVEFVAVEDDLVLPQWRRVTPTVATSESAL